MARIFVSYCYQDPASEKLFVELRGLLEALGASVVTGKAVEAGRPLNAQLEKSITKCAMFVAIVLSGTHSDYVQQEIGYARGRGMPALIVSDHQPRGLASHDLLIDISRGITLQAIQYLVERVRVIVDTSRTGPFTNHIARLSGLDQCDDDELIRFSISHLLQIKTADRYLLVRSNRRRSQFQPVGGVVKVSPGTKNSTLAALGILDDNKVPIDHDSLNDLRVRVPKASVSGFLDWYESCQGREVSPCREFHEEMIATGLLTAEDFPYLDYEFLRTHISGVRFSPYFQCKEVLIAHIDKVVLSARQADAVRAVADRSDGECMLATARAILQRGVDPDRQQLDANIAETGAWTL